jgi:hypothetical protein
MPPRRRVHGAAPEPANSQRSPSFDAGRIIEAHNGQVTIDRPAAGGTTVVIPAADGHGIANL